MLNVWHNATPYTQKQPKNISNNQSKQIQSHKCGV